MAICSPGADRVASRRRCGWRGEDGITYVGLLILIAISAILMGAAAESWQSISQRDREEELIFRGEAYRDALDQFFRQNGHFPSKLEELMQNDPRCIRKLYKEPMTIDGKWVLLHTVPVPGGGKKANDLGKAGSKSSTAGDDDNSDDDASDGDSGQDTSNSGPTLSRVRLGLPGQASRQQLEGGIIVGVASSFSGKAFRNYQGSTEVSEWAFVVQTQPGHPGQPGAQPGGVPSGQPGGAPSRPPLGGGPGGQGFPPLGGRGRPAPPPGGGAGAGPFGMGGRPPG